MSDGGQAGLPVALSNGRSFAVPAEPAVNCQHAYNYKTTSAGSLVTSAGWYGGIIAAFGCFIEK